MQSKDNNQTKSSFNHEQLILQFNHQNQKSPKNSTPTSCTSNQKIIFKRGQMLRYQAFKYQQKYNLAPIQHPPVSYSNKLINQDPFYNTARVHTPSSPKRLSTHTNKISFEAQSQTEEIEEPNFMKFFDAKTLMIKLKQKMNTSPNKNKTLFDFQQSLVSPCAQPQFYSKITRSSLRKKHRTQSDIFFVRTDEYKQINSQKLSNQKENYSVLQQIFDKKSERGRIITKIKEQYSQKQSPIKLISFTSFQNDKIRHFSIRDS